MEGHNRVNRESIGSYNFPKSLNETDIKLVLQQCENQHATSKEQIEGFAIAYSEAKDMVLNNSVVNQFISPEVAEEIVLKWASTIEPRNESGYRTTPVTFRNLNNGLNPNLIDNAMNSFLAGYIDFLQNPVDEERYNPTVFYKEFQTIHPFEDGNGRVGDLLWKLAEACLTKKWPESLPPRVF